MSDLLVALFLFLSGLFIFLASLGLKRFPDLFCRMHATSLASSIAKVFSFGAAGIFLWNDQGVLIKLIGVVLFVLLTSPVSAHLIARAGYKRGALPSKKTWIDELN